MQRPRSRAPRLAGVAAPSATAKQSPCRRSGVHEAHDLPDRLGYTWLAAGPGCSLAPWMSRAAQPAEARALLDEAQDLSLAIHINRNMALCLVAFAV